MIPVATHLRHVGHLARRFMGSLSKQPPTPATEEWAQSFLLPGELALWQRMSNADRRHSAEVARRFKEAVAESSRDEMAGALLHDVGKIDSDLGTVARVAATVVGPVSRRYRRYHDHEAIGLDLLRSSGSSDVTLELCAGTHPKSAALRAADDI